MLFIIHAPGMKPGRTFSLVELVDFYPACVERLGLSIPEGLHGKSLVPVLRDPEETIRDTALSKATSRGAIRSATWHYMKYDKGGEELYDMIKDPHRYTNLVKDPKYAEILNEARENFKARMAAAK